MKNLSKYNRIAGMSESKFKKYFRKLLSLRFLLFLTFLLGCETLFEDSKENYILDCVVYYSFKNERKKENNVTVRIGNNSTLTDEN